MGEEMWMHPRGHEQRKVQEFLGVAAGCRTFAGEETSLGGGLWSVPKTQ